MKIKALGPGDHKIIGKIIGESFAGDPVNEYLLGPQAAITAFNTRMAKYLYLKRGFGHVTEDHTGGSLWLPPGLSTDIAWWNTLDVLTALIWHSGLRRLIRAFPSGQAMKEHRPNHPFYYLYAIGNIPSAQGRGLGGRLMEAGLEKVDQANMPAFLESSKESNISFYRRYGFEVVGEVVLVEGCPPEWLMLRPAQS